MPQLESIFIVILLACALAGGFYVGFLWLFRVRYTRERFAFAALAFCSGLSFVVVLSVLQTISPWEALIHVANHFFGINYTPKTPTYAEYILIAVVYGLSLRSVNNLYQGWTGQKSENQYIREQRSEDSSFLADGLVEAKRILTFQPKLVWHVPTSSKDFLDKLEPMTESLAWKDQARELVRLSSTSYAFDGQDGWHDLSAMWVGKNLDTGGAVLIHPTAGIVTEGTVAEVVLTAEKIAVSKKCDIEKLIIATKEKCSFKYDAIGCVEVVSEEELLNKLVNWSDYVTEIRRRVLFSRLPDSELTVENVYVPSYGTVEKSTEDIEIEAYLQDWLTDRSQRQIALLGEYGQGKSTTALHFTYRLLSDKNAERVPLLIDLRGTSPRNLTPLQLLGAWSSQYNINPQSLLRLHIAGKLILIFEGFDEMSLIGDAEMRLKHFRTLWQFCYPTSKIVITGRPNFFLDEAEMRSALGIYKAEVDHPYCEAVRISLFNFEQIRNSLRLQKEHVRDQICTLVRKNDRFRELVSRPSLLHIVSVLWEKEDLSAKVDRLDSAYIMELFVRHSYTRQGRKESAAPDFMALTKAERGFFMKGIAAFMAAHDLPNQISGSQLGVLVVQLIGAMPEGISVDASTMLGEIRRPLRQRVEETQHGLEHVKTDVRACGLLVDDPAAPGTFRFGHKSFMEFLFAAVLANKIMSDDDASNSILKVTNASMNKLLRLPVSMGFLAELLLANFSAEEAGVQGASTIWREKMASKQLLKSIFSKNRLLYNWSMIGLRYEVLCMVVASRLAPNATIGVRFWLNRAVKIATIGALAYASLKTARMAFYLKDFAPVAMALVTSACANAGAQRGMRLWVALSKQMNISDEAMHKAVGTWWLVGDKKRRFYWEW